MTEPAKPKIVLPSHDWITPNASVHLTGAGQMQTRPEPMWRDMNDAPHDGQVVEVRCTYGVAPWFGLYRWSTTLNRWVGADDQTQTIVESKHFMWRPYTGPVETYVDPTGGRQNDPKYWRVAAARNLNKPDNYFEGKTVPWGSVVGALFVLLAIVGVIFALTR